MRCLVLFIYTSIPVFNLLCKSCVIWISLFGHYIIHMDTSSMCNYYMLHTVSYGQGKGVYGYEVMALGDHMVSIILYHG